MSTFFNFSNNKKTNSSLNFFSLLFCFAIVLGSFLVCGARAEAATYYVRADGTVTCANKANATSPDSADTSLGVLNSANGVNGCTTFSPGDTIYFSAKGGDYTAVDNAFDSLPTAIYIPQVSGTEGNPINFIGLSDNIITTSLANETTNNYPIVDVSSVATGAAGIRVAYINYITVQNFNIKGSGGGFSSVFEMNKSSGTAGNGYTNEFTNINILQGYGAASGNDDCFGGGSATGETAQGIFNNIYASGCRPNPVVTSTSDQCFTLHENAKAQINGMYCADSNNGITNTKATQLTATNITMSNIHTNCISSNMTTGNILVTNSTFNVDGTGGFVGLPNGSGATSYITIQDSIINATAGNVDFVYGGTLNLIGNTWTINSSSFAEKVENGGILNITGGNIFNLVSTINGVFLSDTGAIAPVLNISGSKFIGAGGHIIETYDKGIANVYNNLFINHNGAGVAGWVLVGTTGALNWYNNTHYNSSKAGTALHIQGGGVINDNNNILYNIATPCSGGNCGATGYSSSHNDYYNYTTATNQGVGSVNIDPRFISIGNDFKLSATSTLIDSGTSVGLTTDYAGNKIYGTPDIGAYEYQPPFTFSLHNIPQTGAARLYSDGKYRMTTASSTTATANFSVTPLGGSYYTASTSQYMDITINSWQTTGNKNKQWTATSTAGDFNTHATSTVYTIGDLLPNTYYQFKLDSSASTTAIANNSQCTDGACLSDADGKIVFTYVGGYSTHTFALEKDVTGPSVSLSSPANNSTISSRPTLLWNPATDSESGLAKYQLYIDNILNQDNISPNTNSISPESDLSCGSHSWYIKAIDNQGNSTDSDIFNMSFLCGTIALTRETTYCSAVIYDDWQLSCANGLQYRNIRSMSPSGCALTTAQENERRRQCSPQTATQQPVAEQNDEQTDENNDSDQLSMIISEVKKIMAEKMIIENNFITNGTQSTQVLGAGERKGVIESFKSAFGKNPTTQTDWEDIIKIANGRWPSQTNTETEKNATDAFRKIYQRNPDMANPRDNAAVTIISYGLRPTNRNLNSEKNAIIHFKNIYGYAPKSASAWDIVRAIAYSGAKR